MNIDRTVTDCLPLSVKKIIEKYTNINEIRLSENCPVCITVGNRNLITDSIVSREDLDFCINNLTKNSVHTYFDSIKRGFIPFDNGYRIGVCGNAITDNGVIRNISCITSINIRIPSQQYEVPDDLLKAVSLTKGILVYSQVNTGKTTFLKAYINTVSTPPYNKKVSVIDCKNEFSASKKLKSPVNYFVGYPKYEAINMAVQNMSPDVIVCDEIGLCDDVSPLIECANCGVELVCSAHASSVQDLLKRKNIRRLIDLNVFDGYVGIKIIQGKRIFEFKNGEELFL